MRDRIGSWIVAITVLLCAAGYLAWTALASDPRVAQAGLYPIQAISAAASQFSHAAPLDEWHIPLRSIGVWAIWLLGVVGFGQMFLNLTACKRSAHSAAAQFIFAFGLGFVAFSIIQLILGISGFASFSLVTLFFMFFLASMAIPSYRQLYMRFPRAAVWQWKGLGITSRILAGLILLALAMMLIPALTPPVQSDGMRYHLGAVQEYLKTGRIAYLPLNAYSNMPFLVEMHYMGVLACGAPEAAQLIHFTLAALTSLAIYVLARRLCPEDSRSSRFCAMLCSAVYLGTPMSAILATWPFTDHGISFFLVLGLIAAFDCADSRSWKMWLVFGIILGGLLGTKYTMAPSAVLLLLLPLFVLGAGRKSLVGGILLAAAVAGAIGGVWYLKNLCYTGNPFYPLASSIFPGGDWTPAADSFLHARAAEKDMGKGVAQLFLSPWNATFHWVDPKFESHNPGASILIAVFGALISLVCSAQRTQRSRRLIAVIAIGGLNYLVWFYSYQSNRLLLPVLAVFLSSIPTAFCNASGETVRRVFAGACSLSMLYGFGWAIQWSWLATALTPPPLEYVTGQIDSKKFRYQSLTYARGFDYLNSHVKPAEKVLLIGEHRIFGARFSAIWSDWFDEPALVHILRKNNIHSTDELLAWLQQHQTPWIMINERELAPQIDMFRQRFSAQEWEIFEDLRSLSGSGISKITLPPGSSIIHLESFK